MTINVLHRSVTMASLHRLPTAVIRQYGQTIELPEAAPAHLCRRLTTLRHVADGSMSCGLQVVRRRESLIVPSPLRPNAGLEAILSYEMLQQGYRPITVRQPPLRPLPAPELDLIGGELPVDCDVLNAVQRQPLGLIQYDAGVSPAWMIVQMVRAWPNMAFTVATATHDQATHVRHSLYRHGVKSSLATARSWPDHPKQVVVGTYMALADPEVQKRQIFISANAAHALGEHGQRCLLHPDAGYRLFGFLSTQERVAPWEHDWLIATLGLERIVVPAHGCREVLPNVVWVPIRWHDDSNRAGLERPGSELIAEHHVRNRLITRLAKALVAGNCERLSEDFPSVSSALNGQHAHQVIILVAGVDHAVTLAKRLPGWPIIAGHIVDEYQLPAEHRATLAARRGTWSTGAGMIATAEGARQVDISSSGLVAVVWASAGGHLPPLPPAWRVVPAGEARRLLIVDIDDHGSRVLADWTRQRRAKYNAAEWLPPGTNLLGARIKQFLRSRPGRAAR